MLIAYVLSWISVGSGLFVSHLFPTANSILSGVTEVSDAASNGSPQILPEYHPNANK